MDNDVIDNYQQRIPHIVSRNELCDVFNCDQTGLYLRALPDKTLEAKKETTKGNKILKNV